MRDIRSMIAIIKGDIMASRKLNNPELWLLPLKKQLSSWGQTPYDWELAWGDSFQLEISNPEWALHRALSLKALIRQITEESSKQQHSRRGYSAVQGPARSSTGTVATTCQ